MEQNSKTLMKDYEECKNSSVKRVLFDGVSQIMSGIGHNNMMFTSYCEEYTRENKGCKGCISESACGKTMLLFHACMMKYLLKEIVPENHDIFKILDSMRDIIIRPAQLS